MTNLAEAEPSRNSRKAGQVRARATGHVDVRSLRIASLHRVLLGVPRLPHPERGTLLQSQADLDLRFGIFNTIALLLSSWAIARCVQRPVGRLPSALIRLPDGLFRLRVPGFQGARVGQGDPDGEHVHQRRVLATLFLPDLDPLHPPVDRLRRDRNFVYHLRSQVTWQQLIETGATYWHTVDFLWVLIFALLYIVR